MKYHRIIIWLSFCCFPAILEAQHPLPAWGKDTESFQYDTRVRAYITPKCILWKEATADAVLTGEHYLLKKGNGQAELRGDSLCYLKNGQHGRVSLLLDFGRELQGGVQIVTGQSPSRKVNVRLRFGESVSEAMSEIDGESGATNDHAIRDLSLPLPWLGTVEFGNTGFRFVRIDLLGEHTELILKEVRACFIYKDIPYRGAFECDDERLNRIWMTGAYTVHLNMQEYLWDGIKRDRLVWIGDIYPEVMTINSAFGYNDVVPKSLDLIRDITPVNEWMNGISSYSLWWLLTHYRWYYNHGDVAYLRKQKEYMSALLRRLIGKIDSNGKETLDGQRFLDWPSSENEKAIDAGLQSLMIMTMDAGQEMAKVLGDVDLAEQCREAMGRLRGYPSVCNQSKQAAALMALSGLMDARKANEEVIAAGGAKNFSTFYGYYMLEAMAKAGNYRGAMEVISHYWGAMLDLGATTFWEDFDRDWTDGAARIDEQVPEGRVDVHRSYGDYCYEGFRHSLCHGWASGPTAWLSEHVLGVKVLKPGCKEVLIEPHLGHLRWVKGVYPTPYGDITVYHKRDGRGKVVSRIKAPKGVKIVRKNSK